MCCYNENDTLLEGGNSGGWITGRFSSYDEIQEENTVRTSCCNAERCSLFYDLRPATESSLFSCIGGEINTMIIMVCSTIIMYVNLFVVVILMTMSIEHSVIVTMVMLQVQEL